MAGMLGKPSRSTSLNRGRNIRLLLFLAAILSIVFLTGFAKAFLKDRSIKQEILALEQEKERLEKSKLRILDAIEDFRGGSFIEKEAREKFGLQKPGEKVAVVIDDNKTIRGDTFTAEFRQAGNRKEIGNLGRWWDYFFAPAKSNKNQ